MSNIVLQALNCKIDQKVGLVAVVDAEGQPLACLDGKAHKLQLLLTVKAYKELESRLSGKLRKMIEQHIPANAVINELTHTDGSTFYEVVIILPPDGKHRLVLIDENNELLIPKLFKCRGEAEGRAGEIIEVLAGHVVDWANFDNISMR